MILVISMTVRVTVGLVTAILFFWGLFTLKRWDGRRRKYD